MRYWCLTATEPDLPKVGRNQPCPCGSGRKYKNCHSGKKPRQRRVTLDFGRAVNPDETHVAPDGTVQLRRSGLPLVPVAAKTEEFYDRPKGERILYRFPPSTTQAGTNPNVLLEKYRYIFAIDTNTWVVDSHSVSVAGVVSCRLELKGGRLMAQPYVVGSWSCEAAESPERSAWRWANGVTWT